MSEIAVSRPSPSVAVVTIDRPARRNALNLQAWRDLAAAFRALGRRPGRAAGGVTGAGRAFLRRRGHQRVRGCAGRQRRRRGLRARDRRLLRGDPRLAAAQRRGDRRLLRRRRCAIALCCDFRIMHRGARFGIPATRLGTIYTIAECRFLFAVVGFANAKRILYGSELFDTAAAREMGFADTVVDGDVVESAIAFGGADQRECAARDRRHETHPAGARDRRCRNAATGDRNADPPGARSDDYREGAAAFLEKRPARFTGR